MFALSFTSLALVRIQQAKEFKQERRSANKSPKKPLVPDIARRGIAAIAVLLAIGATSAYARGPLGGGSAAGAGFPRNAASLGSKPTVQPTQFVQQTKPVQQVQQVQTIQHVEPVKQVQHFEPVHQLDSINDAKMVNKLNGSASEVTHRADPIKNPDNSRIVDTIKPSQLNKNLGDAKPLGANKNLNNKNVIEDADRSKNIVKPSGNAGALSRSLSNGSKRAVNGKLVDAIKAGKLDPLTNGPAARKLGMADQFKLMDKGDIARRLKLSDKLEKIGGWKNRMCGPIDSHYCDHCKGGFYCGPKWCPHHCWCPLWCGWVEWCFGCPMWFDPRPDFCEPIECDDYQVDETVVVDRRGIPDQWVDNDPPQPQPDGDADQPDVDLELVAVRFVDNGNAEKNIGPRYRVIIRNNGKQAIDRPFNVAAVLGAAEPSDERTPRAGKRVKAIAAGQTMAIDIRLPAEANASIKCDDGPSVEKFPKLAVMVDTRNEVEEPNKDNNGMAFDRSDILMADPAIFAADVKQATLGQTIKLAGEGLGPEAGQVLVRVGGLELQAEIEGWYDLGVEIKLPSLPLAGEAKAELVVVRGDGAAANPITMPLAATQSAPPAPPEE
jgi:hypothetical protein